MHAKLEELESFYAAYKQSRARRSGRQAEDFGDLAEFDGDLLLKMVDELESNMKLSRSEVAKGRAYEDYAERRGAKLREEEVGWKGKQRRKEMEAMENRFEESWVKLKTRRRDAPKTAHKEVFIGQFFDMFSLFVRLMIYGENCVVRSQLTIPPRNTEKTPQP